MICEFSVLLRSTLKLAILKYVFITLTQDAFKVVLKIRI